VDVGWLIGVLKGRETETERERQRETERDRAEEKDHLLSPRPVRATRRRLVPVRSTSKSSVAPWR
jgi:hypothetical protein